MAVTVSLYDHTSKRFAEGSNSPSDTFKLILCTAATFDAANTTLASITKTEVANGFGYTTGGQTLTGVAVTTVTTNDAKFTADNVTWSASGGPIAASYAILFNDSDADDPPLLFIDFGGEESAGDGTDFRVIWNVNGIVNFTVA